MIEKTTHAHRILAVDPTSKGFGFVVFEGKDKLVDWGLREARGDKKENSLRGISILIDLYKPGLILLEDVRHGSRRCERVQKLILDIKKLAKNGGMATREINKEELRKTFSPLGANTKDAIAKLMAEHFPDLAPHLPPPRPKWKSQNPMIAIFMAAAMSRFE